jgi:outer membrane protein OmpA-like peptidoglycan-associated protein
MNTLPNWGAAGALPPRFRRAAISAAVLAACASPFAVQAQTVLTGVAGVGAADIPVTANGGALNFTGASSQVGIGIDRDSHIHGLLSRVLTEDGLSALIAQGWLSRGAGGVRLDYNWIGGQDDQPAVDGTVRKVFAAVDRNRDADRKLTIGFGLERENWFGQVSYSHGLSDRRWAGPTVVVDTTEQQTGTESGRPYVDTVTTSTATRIFERAYDQGVGVRAGHFYADALVRVSAGLDHEWGDFSARQDTVSLGAEKFFAGTPHSLGLSYEQFHKSGEFETQGDGHRLMLMYRFSFGGPTTEKAPGWRETRSTRQVAVPATTATEVDGERNWVATQETRTEQRVVKTTASMTSDAFFEFNRAELSAAAKNELDRIADILRTTERAGAIRIAGHTCDIGPDAYNLKLSLRRATAVRDYLVARGKLPADLFVVEGLGKRQPKYPSTPELRAKNRRVDLEFVQYQDKIEQVQVPVDTPPRVQSAPPVVEWKTEVIDHEPAWVRRALRNAVPHKQTVDTYRGAEASRTSHTSRAYLNRNPVAQGDALRVTAGVATAISVLDNDSDPDGNALRVVAVGAPAHGTATLSGNAITYTSAGQFSGVDSFSYTVDDGAGGQAAATVTVTVDPANRAPQARDDEYVVGGVGIQQLEVLQNDFDPDGDTLSIASFTQPGTGVLTRSGNGLLFRSTGKFARTTFTYVASDGRGATSTATVTLIDP